MSLNPAWAPNPPSEHMGKLALVVRTVGRAAVLCCACAAVIAGDVREQTRLVTKDSTTVTGGQAADLTLTLADVATRSIQTWVRTAAHLDASGKFSVAIVRGELARLVGTGQRARVFSLANRTQMQQARVIRVDAQDGGVVLTAALAGRLAGDQPRLLMEIVVDRGRFLSVPNIAIIEEQDRRIVYVQTGPGSYTAREIHAGLQGEQYTEVLDGVTEGEEVVSVGSFFVDAEEKLKSPGGGAP